MAHPAHHHQINYIEFYSTDIERTKKFYGTVFGWSFKDCGPDYIDCNLGFSGVAIGFARIDASEGPGKGAPLVVLYSADLKGTEEAIVAAGGSIVVPVFDFPGGRRFHFSDGAGNVLAVWSE